MDSREQPVSRPGDKLRNAEEAADFALEMEAERYRRLFRASPVGMVRESTRGTILEVNEAALRLLGREDPEELLDHPAGELFADPEKAERSRSALLREGEVEPREVLLHHVDGASVWVQETSVLIPTTDPGGTEILRTLVDVGDRRRKERDLEKLAYLDPLTGVANRRLLDIRADQTLALADRRGLRVGVIFLDLVNFKQINDTHGHGAGDELLSHVGRCLEGALRSADTVARIGGDEFAVLLSEVDDKKAARRAVMRLLRAISTPWSVDGSEVVVTARAGVSVFPDDETNFEELLAAADRALIRAKGGRIEVVVTEPDEGPDGSDGPGGLEDLKGRRA